MPVNGCSTRAKFSKVAVVPFLNVRVVYIHGKVSEDSSDGSHLEQEIESEMVSTSQRLEQPFLMRHDLPLHPDILMRRGLHLQTCRRLCPLYPMKSVQARKRGCYTYRKHRVSKGFRLDRGRTSSPEIILPLLVKDPLCRTIGDRCRTRS